MTPAAMHIDLSFSPRLQVGRRKHLTTIKSASPGHLSTVTSMKTQQNPQLSIQRLHASSYLSRSPLSPLLSKHQVSIQSVSKTNPFTAQSSVHPFPFTFQVSKNQYAESSALPPPAEISLTRSPYHCLDLTTCPQEALCKNSTQAHHSH